MKSLIKNILVGEDDIDDYDLFAAAVRDVCPEITLMVAANGMEVLRHLHESPFPDAIFLDINMPLMGGISCLQNIRTNPYYNDVPVIMLSTANNKSEVDYCLANGANFYFRKPISYEGLKDIIQDLCDGKLTTKNRRK